LKEINNLQNYFKSNNKINQEEANNETGDQTVEKKNLPTHIRKLKKAVRRINKLKRLYKELEKEKIKDLDIIEKNKTKPKKEKTPKCTCCFIILFIALLMVILNDFILPILLNYAVDYDDKYKKEESLFGLVVGVILSIPLAIIFSPYTCIIIYTTNAKRYITGDFLYDKKINDDLSLIKTVQIVCGYSFAIVYCNNFYYKAMDRKNILGKPIFYQEIIIPDYTIKYGISVFMIVKLLIIIISIIGTFCFYENSFFKNDLSEYILTKDDWEFNQDKNFDTFLENKKQINDILKRN
jgi:hypothetical protein